MRLLANEIVPAPVVRALRDLGHVVAWVLEGMRAAADLDVLARAQSEERTVLTFDKDFGELAFRARLPASCGIVLVRLAGSDPGADSERVIAALISRDDWSGQFAVVEDDRIRVRPLPARTS